MPCGHWIVGGLSKVAARKVGIERNRSSGDSSCPSFQVSTHRSSSLMCTARTVVAALFMSPTISGVSIAY